MYFHYMPPPKSNMNIFSWGHWSLNADPNAGLLPDYQSTLDGLELIRR